MQSRPTIYVERVDGYKLKRTTENETETGKIRIKRFMYY